LENVIGRPISRTASATAIGDPAELTSTLAISVVLVLMSVADGEAECVSTILGL